MPTPIPLSDVVSLLHTWYPPHTAEAWDAVGLVAGDPEQNVAKVMFAVDVTASVAAEAAEWGADLLVVHHPLFLKPVHGVAATTPKGRTLAILAKAGCALLTAHTNADRARGGVSEALALALGLEDVKPILVDPGVPVDKLTTFVPTDAAAIVRAALAEAGAGTIGDYDFASFSTPGEGRFRPLEGATPMIGTVGEIEVVPEVRIEVILPRSRRAEVVGALLTAHPYEEPAYDVVELADGEVALTGTGRIGTIARQGLGEFAGGHCRSAAGDGARRTGGGRSRAQRPSGRGLRRSRRLPAGRRPGHRRRRLRDQRPAPPCGL